MALAKTLDNYWAARTGNKRQEGTRSSAASGDGNSDKNDRQRGALRLRWHSARSNAHYPALRKCISR